MSPKPNLHLVKWQSLGKAEWVLNAPKVWSPDTWQDLICWKLWKSPAHKLVFIWPAKQFHSDEVLVPWHWLRKKWSHLTVAIPSGRNESGATKLKGVKAKRCPLASEPSDIGRKGTCMREAVCDWESKPVSSFWHSRRPYNSRTWSNGTNVSCWNTRGRPYTLMGALGKQ